jgi:hypothetical protein
MERTRLLLPFAVLALLAVCDVIHACECNAIGNAKDEMEKSGAVFVGTVVAVYKDKPHAVRSGKGRVLKYEDSLYLLFKFKVTEWWKGFERDADTVLVRTMKSHFSFGCGYDFRQGDTYLVYASGTSKNRWLSTTRCMRTARLEDAQEDLRQLGSGQRLPGPAYKMTRF